MMKKIFLLGIFILGLFPVLEQGKLKPGLLQEAYAGGWGDEYGEGGNNGGSNPPSIWDALTFNHSCQCFINNDLLQEVRVIGQPNNNNNYTVIIIEPEIPTIIHEFNSPTELEDWYLYWLMGNDCAGVPNGAAYHSPCGCVGGTTGKTCPPQDPNKPCDGDPIKNPEIARSNSVNIQGGRIGYTRSYEDGSPKYHGGLDVFAEPNTPIYAIYGGVVTRSIGSYPSTYYGSPISLGNLIEIQTIINGNTVKILYAHMNSVNYSVGENISVGMEIGLSGRTGNAQKGYSPHVHIQVKNNGTTDNPESYITTKFEANGQAINTPCP